MLWEVVSSHVRIGPSRHPSDFLDVKLAWNQSRAGLQYLEEEWNKKPKDPQATLEIESLILPPPLQLQVDVGDGGGEKGNSLGADYS